MIQSMTGYARAERRGEWGLLALELRSVNHRFLEIHFRLPEPLRSLEVGMREQIGTLAKRGKLDCSLRYEPSADAATKLVIDDALAAAIGDAAARVAKTLAAPAPVDPLGVLRWPGVLSEPAIDADLLGTEVSLLLAAALDDLVASRTAEGARLETMLQERAQAIAALVASVRARLPAVREQIHAKLTARLDELELARDDDRLQQELVHLAQRMDIAEEMDRLDSHIVELRETLARAEPVGRRLDFLMQEFNREATTLASKSQDAETTHAAVEIKVLIEQMREQVQNVQ
jgi:uncharacterized protein (TIGR00255 family)